MQLSGLKVLHRDGRIAVDKKPYFSWILESEDRDTVQVSYNLTVKDRKGQEVFSSGEITSDQNDYVYYEGDKLEDCEKYSWHVLVKDNHGNEALGEGIFLTGFLNGAFKGTGAEWISEEHPDVKREVGFGKQPAATVFRKKLNLEKMPVSAELFMTSHGAYEFTVNGKNVTNRKLATEYSSFDKILFYQNYDITAALCKGENEFLVTVGDGWYCSIKNMMKVELEDKYHALMYAIKLIYEDGSFDWIGSDSSTECTKSAIVSSDLYAGEIYDARLELSENTKWESCVARDFDRGILKAQISDGITVAAEVKPVKLYVSPKGEHIIDFGQNMAGVVRFKSRLKKDEKIVLDHFEVTDRAGNYFNSIIDGGDVGKGCEQRTIYISNGQEAVYEPHFTFQGFRYIRIEAPEDYELRAEDFTALAMATKNDAVGDFECSDDRLNRLYLNTIWSQHSNMISIPTDCPQREKAGWTGDIAVYSKTALQNEDVNAFLENWLLSLTADQSEEGILPIVSPYNHIYRETADNSGKLFLQKDMVGSAGWADAGVLVPWAMYQVSGNTDILAKQYESMKKWVDYVIRTADEKRHLFGGKYEKYLWNTGFHFGDWLIPSLSKKGYDLKLLFKAIMGTRKFVAPTFAYNSTRIVSQTAQLLGKADEAEKYALAAEKMKEAITHTLIDADGKAKSRKEYMGLYVLLIAFDLLDEETKKKAGENLVRMLNENDGCLDTGFLGTPYILDALCMSGHTDTAYRLLMNDKCPSWLYEVDKGATTIWESWFSYDEKDEPMGLSYNHYAFGCVDDWIFRYIGGITPTSAGYKTFDIRIPEEIMGTGIRSARRSFMSENGLIECDWEIVDGKLSMKVKVPCNTKATVYLWDGSSKTVGSGCYNF